MSEPGFIGDECDDNPAKPRLTTLDVTVPFNVAGSYGVIWRAPLQAATGSWWLMMELQTDTHLGGARVGFDDFSAHNTGDTLTNGGDSGTFGRPFWNVGIGVRQGFGIYPAVWTQPEAPEVRVGCCNGILVQNPLNLYFTSPYYPCQFVLLGVGAGTVRLRRVFPPP